jgi:glutamate-ammonia-ligase adenylyltransferase
MRRNLSSNKSKTAADLFDLKNGVGGIVDIEFLGQYHVLAHSHTYPELTQWTDNVRILDTIKKLALLDRDKVNLLKDSYLVFRRRQHRLVLQEKPAIVARHLYAGRQEKVAAVWREVMEDGG